MIEKLPPSWQQALAAEFEKPYFRQLIEFLRVERQQHVVYPPEDDVFTSLWLTPIERVKVVIVGQDPYHGEGQAHGLSFSVAPGVKPPPSLVNILRELNDDLGCPIPNHGCLAQWAQRGVLLLNASLTVRAHEPNSHKDIGWELFTDAILRTLNDRSRPMVFLLWGKFAQKKGQLISAERHRVITGAHPSPLSAKKFLGSRPFSAVNRALQELGDEPIQWELAS